MALSVNFELSAIFISLLGLIYCLTIRRSIYRLKNIKGNPLYNQHFLYLGMLICILISCSSSFLNAYIELNATAATVPLQMFLHLLYFIFHTVIPTIYTLYIMSLNGSTIGQSNRFILRLCIPIILCEILILISPFTKSIFYLDEALHYRRGPLMILLYLCAAFYVALGTRFFFLNKHAVTETTSRIISALVIISISGILIQMINSSVVVETFAEALSFLGFLLTLEDTDRNLDPLTNVYHRIAFDEESRKRIRSGHSYSVLHIHPNNLSTYARILSVRSSDKLIASIAAWLTQVTRKENVFSYHTQDFLVISDEQDEANVEAFAHQILDRFQQPWHVDDLYATLNATISLIRIPDDAGNDQELEQILDIASTKQAHESMILTADDIAQFKRELLIEKLLGKAIEKKTVEVWYQPIWSSEENKIIAAEALARLIDPEYGFIPPDEFIPIAEKNGMINALGALVFEKVCQFIASNPQLELHYIEVNLSMYQFLQEHLDQDLLAMTQKYGISPSQINLEITESMANIAPLIENTVQSLRSVGFTFSLDDYGSAYSNVQRLITGDFTNIKIDKSILWDSDTSEKAQRMLKYLTQTIRSLGLNVIQEGVETEEQLERIKEYGCNMVQGYYFSKPVKEVPFIDYVISYNKP